ncbi:MAG: hypothetical protein AB7H43_13450 [Acidimicrobiia bacterium]
MTILTDAGRHALLTGGLGNAITHYSVHTAFPGLTGANEAAGGTPAYARKAATWAAAAAGKRANSAAAAFDLPAGTYGWAGGWSASTAGTFYAATPLGGKPMRSVSLQGTGATSTTVFTQPNHGLANGARLVLFDVSATGMPAGFAEGTTYFVVNATVNTFQLAATAGGTPIASTSSTEVFAKEQVPVVLSAQGVLDLGAGASILNATIL